MSLPIIYGERAPVVPMQPEPEPVVDQLAKKAHAEAPGLPVVLERWRGEWRVDVRRVRT